MSRRLSKKTDNKIPESEPADTIATPKKGRKAVKVEELEVVAKSPTKTTKKKAKAVIEYEENVEELKDSPKIKIKSVKAKAVLEEEKAPKPKKASAKRKPKAEDDDEEDDEGEKKVTKKRKTKEEKEAENMPLAPRTAIGTLKKAMHIGAHVSGAGGSFS
jgi:AP endonuclease 1